MRKIKQRILVFFIMSLMVFSSITFPLTIARKNKTNSIPDSISVTGGQETLSVLEYRPDGTIAVSSVHMSEVQARQFEHELYEVTGIEEKISIYKKYNQVINTASNMLQNTIVRFAKTFAGSREKLIPKTNLPYSLLHFSFFSMISGYGQSYLFPTLIFIPFGTSLFRVNGNPGETPKVISLDLVDHVFGAFEFHSKGILHSFGGSDFVGTIKIVGFVGYVYMWSGRHGFNAQAFDGFAIYVRAFGIFL